MFKDHRTSGGCWGDGGINLEGSTEQRGAARGSTTKAAQNKQLSIVWKLHRKNKYVSKITYFPSSRVEEGSPHHIINNHATSRNKVLSTNTAYSSPPLLVLRVLYKAAMATG